MGSWFSAKRDGACGHCGKAVKKGDQMFARGAGVYVCGECGILAENEPRLRGPIEEGVEYDLSTLPDEASRTMIAQSMLKAARQLDMDDVSPRDASSYMKELRMNWMQLRDLFPQKVADDPTDAARESRERLFRERYN